MRYISPMDWTVETVSVVDAEIAALPVALSARLLRLLETAETSGWKLSVHRMSSTSTGNSGNFGCAQTAVLPAEST